MSAGCGAASTPPLSLGRYASHDVSGYVALVDAVWALGYETTLLDPARGTIRVRSRRPGHAFTIQLDRDGFAVITPSGRDVVPSGDGWNLPPSVRSEYRCLASALRQLTLETAVGDDCPVPAGGTGPPSEEAVGAFSMRDWPSPDPARDRAVLNPRHRAGVDAELLVSGLVVFGSAYVMSVAAEMPLSYAGCPACARQNWPALYAVPIVGPAFALDTHGDPVTTAGLAAIVLSVPLMLQEIVGIGLMLGAAPGIDVVEPSDELEPRSARLALLPGATGADLAGLTLGLDW